MYTNVYSAASLIETHQPLGVLETSMILPHSMRMPLGGLSWASNALLVGASTMYWRNVGVQL